VALATYVTTGLLTGVICLLMHGKDWEKQKRFLLPAAAIEDGHLI
jgi:hypothetical protein